MTDFKDVLHFWFEELKPEQQFGKSEKVDASIRQRFGATLKAAARGELYEWRKTPEGRFAEIIVLDQFSRNVYRDKPESFAQDPMALTLAQEMVQLGLDVKIPMDRRAFVYMPYMHSESTTIHDAAAKLFAQPGLELTLKYEHLHRRIIDEFGRYPHRNKILGRPSTPQEIEFLKTDNSSF